MAATLREKMQFCNRCVPCKGHGPYLYSAQKIAGKVKWKYIGKISKTDYLLRVAEDLLATGVAPPEMPMTVSEALVVIGHRAVKTALAQEPSPDQMFADALATLGVEDDITLTRETLRKRVWNRLRRKGITDQEIAKCNEAFEAICCYKCWARSRPVVAVLAE